MDNALLHAVLFACGLLAAGLALRAGVRPLRALFVPASVVAGAVGFGLVQAGTRVPATAGMTQAVVGEMKSWPGWLIAVVFAGLLLERPAAGGVAQALRRGARSGLFAWIIILGQIAIGLAVYLLLVRPAQPAITPAFGQLLEVSWAGGHGASAAMGEVYRSLGFAEGKDVAFFLATVGLVYGVVSGLVFVNLALRRGWVVGGTPRAPGARVADTSGLDLGDSPLPIGFARTRGEVLEPLALQVIVLAAAFAAGYGLQRAFVTGAGLVLGADVPTVTDQPIDFARNVPLFLFTLIGGLFVRVAMQALRIDRLIDGPSVQRIVGVSMEFLIVAAVATLQISALRSFGLAVAALVVLAAAWSAFCLLVLAPRLLPRAYWFELGLLNYGFSTANTPQGMMLLRIVDPELKSGAAEDYAVAAPLSAPFVGGGVVTVVAMPLLLQSVPTAAVLAGLVAAAVAFYAAGRRLASASSSAGARPPAIDRSRQTGEPVVSGPHDSK